jgi:RNA polymerase sigma-70 factor (ECF subfamily)
VKGNEKVSLDESPEFLEELGSVEPNVRENLDREERLEIILCEMKRLSPQQRTALTLRYFEGLPLSEIAELLECSEGSVKQHLYRAMDRLKHILCVKEVR